jgi:hypothetical protein
MSGTLHTIALPATAVPDEILQGVILSSAPLLLLVLHVGSGGMKRRTAAKGQGVASEVKADHAFWLDERLSNGRRIKS